MLVMWVTLCLTLSPISKILRPSFLLICMKGAPRLRLSVGTLIGSLRILLPWHHIKKEGRRKRFQGYNFIRSALYALNVEPLYPVGLGEVEDAFED